MIPAARLLAVLRNTLAHTVKRWRKPKVAAQGSQEAEVADIHSIRPIPRSVDEFVEQLGYWEAEYFRRAGLQYDVPYFANIRPGCELDESNVGPLWKWKVRERWLPKVLPKALLILAQTNQFRKGDIGEKKFWEACRTVSQFGTVWQVFCFHVARPHQYPIFDQNAARARWYLTTGEVVPEPHDLTPSSHSYKQFIENYGPYKNFFLELLPRCCGNARVLDRALWKLGKHLREANTSG